MIILIYILIIGNVTGFTLIHYEYYESINNSTILPYIVYSFECLFYLIDLFIYHTFKSHSICVITSLLLFSIISLVFIVIFYINIKTYFTIYCFIKFLIYIYILARVDFSPHNNQRNENNMESPVYINSNSRYSPPTLPPTCQLNPDSIILLDELCYICFDNPIAVIELKCSHGDRFCYDCKNKLDICPFCREKI
jgi:hypothetical protein